MAKENIQHARPINWTVIYNIAGVIAIMIIAGFLYRVIRDTDDLTHDPLEDTIPQLTPEQARERLQQNRNVILLDVRSSVEWQNVPHAEGAQSLPLQELEERALEELDIDAEIILMCYSGNTRSMPAAEWLREHGFSNVSNLDGGLKAWTAASLPTEETTTQ